MTFGAKKMTPSRGCLYRRRTSVCESWTFPNLQFHHSKYRKHCALRKDFPLRSDLQSATVLKTNKNKIVKRVFKLCSFGSVLQMTGLPLSRSYFKLEIFLIFLFINHNHGKLLVSNIIFAFRKTQNLFLSKTNLSLF